MLATKTCDVAANLKAFKEFPVPVEKSIYNYKPRDKTSEIF